MKNAFCTRQDKQFLCGLFHIQITNVETQAFTTGAHSIDENPSIKNATHPVVINVVVSFFPSPLFKLAAKADKIFSSTDKRTLCMTAKTIRLNGLRAFA